jgi:uncharacterized protein (TIGR02996 family)
VKHQRPVTSQEAFLQAIRAEPDDDAHRLVYADWLDENGDPDRAEFIRVQCELARCPEGAERRSALAARAAELLAAHRLAWTDLAFADWLGHRKSACRNPLGHDFCKLLAQGIRTRCARDVLPADDPARKKLDRKLESIGEKLERQSGYLPATCEAGLFDDGGFRRGFVDVVGMEAYVARLFGEALADLTLVRVLGIEDNSGANEEEADPILRRLLAVHDRLSLEVLDLAVPVTSADTLRMLADSPHSRRLSTLDLWCDFGATGDEAAGILAGSPNMTGLRSLILEHSATFTDSAFGAILDSPHLTGLTACVLHPNDEPLRISAPLVARFQARFGAPPRGRG